MQSLIIILLIPLIFYLLEKVIPNKNNEVSSIADIEELRKKFRKVETAILLLLLPAIALFSFLLSHTFIWINRLLLNYLFSSQYDYVLGGVWLFVFPGMMIASVGVMYLFSYIFEKIGRKIADNDKEWEAYYADYNIRTSGGRNINNNKLAQLLAFTLVPTGLAILLLGFNNYALINEESIVTNTFWGIKDREHNMNEVHRILFIDQFKNKQSGQIEKTAAHYSIVFKDGDVWSSLNFEGHGTNREKEVANFISMNSDIPITHGIHNVDDKIDQR